MSSKQKKHLILSLTLFIFTIVCANCQNFLNLSGDMVSKTNITINKFLFQQKKCLQLKEKYPGLNCEEVLAQKELDRLNHNESLKTREDGDGASLNNKTCNFSMSGLAIYNGSFLNNSENYSQESMFTIPISNLKYTNITNSKSNQFSNQYLNHHLNKKEFVKLPKVNSALNNNTNSNRISNDTSNENTQEESILINLNKTESSPLLSIKSSDDLKLTIDINNTGLNETISSEEFLAKMMQVSNVKAN
jgi:hypothetical protein